MTYVYYKDVCILEYFIIIKMIWHNFLQAVIPDSGFWMYRGLTKMMNPAFLLYNPLFLLVPKGERVHNPFYHNQQCFCLSL